MKSAGIKRLAKKIRIKSSTVNHERILSDAEAALLESTKDGSKVSRPAISIWRAIMKSRIAKLAAAAAIIIMAVVGGYAGYEALTTETEEREGLAFGIRDVTGADVIGCDGIRADVIVRAKILAWSYDTGYGKLEVIKVLYGQAPATKVITCWHGDDEPPDYETHERPGAEIILGLASDGEGYVRISSHGPYDDADEAEKRIIKWIEKVTK